MNRSILLVTAGIAALGMAACMSTPTPTSKPTPSGMPTSASTPAPTSGTVPVVTEVVTQTVTNPSTSPEKPVIGSFGYGELKLGMTLQQALDTKLIGPDKINIPTSQCTLHDILGT